MTLTILNRFSTPLMSMTESILEHIGGGGGEKEKEGEEKEGRRRKGGEGGEEKEGREKKGRRRRGGEEKGRRGREGVSITCGFETQPTESAWSKTQAERKLTLNWSSVQSCVVCT